MRVFTFFDHQSSKENNVVYFSKIQKKKHGTLLFINHIPVTHFFCSYLMGLKKKRKNTNKNFFRYRWDLILILIELFNLKIENKHGLFPSRV